MGEADLSSLLMLDQGSVNEIEAGERLSDETELLMLGSFFHVYPDKLLRGEIEAKRTYGEILKLAGELFEKVSRIKASSGHGMNAI